MFNPFPFIFVILELKFFLTVAHWGHEAKHKFLKKMLHIGDNVAHWVHPVYVKFLFSGIAAVVRVDIENALKDDEWLSTDFMLFLKEKYENEKSIQKK